MSNNVRTRDGGVFNFVDGLKVKNVNIEDYISGQSTTNLSTTVTATTVNINSSTGSDATIPVATSTEAGVMSAADKVKLSGIDLTAKQDTLVSGTNIKTINGTAILGSGNIVIAGGGGASDASDVTYNPTWTGLTATNVQAAVTELDTEKQPMLVSGTNIKSINGTSLLGTGNINLSASGSAADVSFSPIGSIAATNVQAAIAELDTEKQVALVSGTNIKTVNGTSLLGSGNITISGSGTVDANAIKTALTSVNATHNWIWNSDIPGAVNAGANQCIYIQRNAAYSSAEGAAGGVLSAMYLETFTPTTTHNTFEWTLTATMHSRSIQSIITEGPLTGFASPQNVAINGTAFRDAGNAPIWGGNFVAYHMDGQYTSAKGAMHGVEINIGGNGTDAGESTIGVYIVPQLRSDVAGPGSFSAWTGLLVHGNGSANFRNAITIRSGSVFGYLDQGTHAVGIDLSTATNSQAAIRIKADDPIAFEATGFIKMKYEAATGRLVFMNGTNGRGYIDMTNGSNVDFSSVAGVTLGTEQTITGYKTFTGGVKANGAIFDNGIVFGASGTAQWAGAMVTTSAVAGWCTLPPHPEGFITIIIDGQQKKVPYYG